MTTQVVVRWNNDAATNWVRGRMRRTRLVPIGSGGMRLCEVFDENEVVNAAYVLWRTKTDSGLLQYTPSICLKYAWKSYWKDQKINVRRKSLAKRYVRNKGRKEARYETRSLYLHLREYPLTKMQRSVLDLLGHNYTSVEIAKVLGISAPRVCNIRHRLAELADTQLPTTPLPIVRKEAYELTPNGAKLYRPDTSLPKAYSVACNPTRLRDTMLDKYPVEMIVTH